MWWIPALIGGVLSITGRLVGRARRNVAVQEAIEQAAENLHEGQAISTQNAQQLAQDNTAILSLSGVSATEGTASQLQQQVKLQSQVTINKMTKDYENYVANLRAQDNADAANTAFSVLGDVFSTVGRMTYDAQRLNFGGGQEVVSPVGSYQSPDLRINENWVTPLGMRRMGSLTGGTPPSGGFRSFDSYHPFVKEMF